MYWMLEEICNSLVEATANPIPKAYASSLLSISTENMLCGII